MKTSTSEQIDLGLPSATVIGTQVWHYREVGSSPPEAVGVAEERKRLEKELNKVRRERTMVETKLAKEDYLTKAPEAIVAKDKGRHAALVEKEARLESSIDALPSGGPEHEPADS